MQLSEIKGLGKATEKYLNELGIYDVDDLINYYPFRYEVIENTDISSLKDGDKIVIGGICSKTPTVYYFNKKLNKMNFTIDTGDFIAKVEIFNRAFLKGKLNVGLPITVIGKYNQRYDVNSDSEVI